MFQLLSDEQIEPLGEAVYAVLEQVGMLCQNEQMLDALAAAGADVDRAEQRVLFPRAMVAEFLDAVRREHAVADRAMRGQFAAGSLPKVGLQVAPLGLERI